jgi:hypothetical protein
MKRHIIACISSLAAIALVAPKAHAVVAELQTANGTLKIVQEPEIVATEDATFVDMPGMTTTIKTKNNGLLVIRFVSQAFCSDGADNGCSGFVQVLVDDVVVPPADVAPFVNQPGDLGTLSLAIDRAVGGLTKGAHTVKVQIRTSASDQFSLLNSQMTVQALK